MLVENGYRMSDNWSRAELGNVPDTVRYTLLLWHAREKCVS
jgi:hypothetical protein